MEIAALKVKQSAKRKLFSFYQNLCKIISSKTTRKYLSTLLKDNYFFFLPKLLISIKQEWVDFLLPHFFFFFFKMVE